MESQELMKQFLKAGNRFRKTDLGVLHQGISQGEYIVLEEIHAGSRQNGGIRGARISGILQEMCVLPPALSRLLRSLEEKGLIIRQMDPTDRRNTCVCLTDEGERTRQKGRERMISLGNAIVEHMGEEQIKELIALWNLLADVLEGELKEYNP